MSRHSVYFGSLATAGPEVVVEGEEAHHALRTKRLEVGHAVEILDGLGNVAHGKIVEATRVRRGEWAMRVAVEQLRTVPQGFPRLELVTGVPKGPRLEALIDSVSQTGASAWRPLKVRRSVVDPRPTKLERLSRVASESGKQCGRAWFLQIGKAATLAQALELEDPDMALVIADVSGEAYRASGVGAIRLLVGPEGGFESSEIEQAVAAGARVARFGEHTMRIETAAAVAAGVILDLERREAPERPGPVSSAERSEV